MTRRGFTIIELMIATAIAGIVAAAMTMTLSRQQRFFASADAIIEVRGQLRDAADVLASDLRGAAVAAFGFPVMTDSAVEMYAVVGTSIACTVSPGSSVGLPPQSLALGHTLTSFVAPPDTGDLAMLYGIPAGLTDSARWQTFRIASFASRSVGSSCPSSSGFTTSSDIASGMSGFLATIVTPPGTVIAKGSPLVFVRRVRYSLYRSSDGLWYLGYRRCSVTGVGCAAVQPVSGPYRAFSSGSGNSGLSFRYYDEWGSQLTVPTTQVARVDIVLRGQTARNASLAGDALSAFRDSVVVTVSPRNRQ